MDELEKLRKHWQDDDFQRKHALAREIVVNRLRELNREYEEKQDRDLYVLSKHG